MDGGIVT